jgi:hypothetical protein
MKQDGSYRTVYAARHGDECFSVFGHIGCEGVGVKVCKKGKINANDAE